jgi:NADH:ubiquinone oxidoreductase subunit 5 (subunit L)/multisubunit Na+/H+ antiporter MnhA subunit
MPVTFAIFLFSGLSLAGVPPLNGFSSKWMIYEAALQSGHYFLAMAALVSSLFTLAAILKFAHAAFMGRTSSASAQMTEAPASMLATMGLLTAANVVVSLMPGILLVPISHLQLALGLPAIETTWFGPLPGSNQWSPSMMFALLVVLAIAGWGYLRLSSRKTVRTQLYTCGAVDFDLDSARVNASNLYEGPDALIHGVFPEHEEEEIHA